MIIPGIVNTGVQPLASPDPNVPTRLAEKFSDAIGDVRSSFDRFKEAQANAQSADASVAVANDMAEFEKQTATKLEYHPEELDPEILAKVNPTVDEMDPSTGQTVSKPRMIPKGEVYPYLYENAVKNSIKANSAKITDVRYQNKWNKEISNMSKQHVDKAFIDAVQIRRDEANENLNRQITNSMQLGRYDLAEVLVDKMDVSEENKSKMRLEVQKGKEENDYLEAMSEQDVDKMKSSLQFLQDKGYSNSGKLDDKSRLSYIRQLDSSIANIESVKKAKLTVAAKETEREARDMAIQLAKGENISPAAVNSLRSKIEKFQAQGVEINPDVIHDLGRSEEIAVNTKKLSNLNNSSVMSVLADLQARPANSADDSIIRERTISAANDMLKARQDNTIQAMETYGTIKLAPVLANEDPNSQDTLSDRLAVRKLQSKTAQQMTGSFTGYLTNDERKTYKTMWDASPPEQRMQFITEARKGLGEDSVYMFQEIFNEDTSSAAVAGEMVAHDNDQAAMAIIMGSQYKNDVLPESIDEQPVDKFISQQMGTLYASNPGKKARVAAAVQDMMKYRIANEGAKPDKALVKSSLAAITGGFIDFNGAQISAPKKGVDEDSLKKWFRDTNPEYLNKFGGAAGISNKEVWDGIKSGDIVLSDRGHNQYYLKNKKGQFVHSKATNSPMLFSYDENSGYDQGSVSKMGDAPRKLADPVAMQRMGFDVETTNALKDGLMELVKQSDGVYQVRDSRGGKFLIKKDGTTLTWNSKTKEYQ